MGSDEFYEAQPLSLVPGNGWVVYLAWHRGSTPIAARKTPVVAFAAMAGCADLTPMVSINGSPPCPIENWQSADPSLVWCLDHGQFSSPSNDEQRFAMLHIQARAVEGRGTWNARTLTELASYAGDELGYMERELDVERGDVERGDAGRRP